MTHKKMVNGGVVKQWTCINFSRYMIVDTAQQFRNELAQMRKTPEVVEETSADAFLLYADQASVKQRTKACYADQPANPKMGQTDIERDSWIYFI
jgi:eukaryotic translation initiation factor 2C